LKFLISLLNPYVIYFQENQLSLVHGKKDLTDCL